MAIHWVWDQSQSKRLKDKKNKNSKKKVLDGLDWLNTGDNHRKKKNIPGGSSGSDYFI